MPSIAPLLQSHACDISLSLALVQNKIAGQVNLSAADLVSFASVFALRLAESWVVSGFWLRRGCGFCRTCLRFSELSN
jgi:hypothetical protein